MKKECVQILLTLFIFVPAFVGFWVWWSSCRSRLTYDLTDYHVLITGGSSGIGLSLAKLFYQSGATVTIVARDKEKLKQAKETLCRSDGDASRVYTLPLDLRSSYYVLSKELESHVTLVGHVDIMVHCAGYAVARTLMDTTPEEIEGLMRTNYLGGVNVAKILLPYMLTTNKHSPRDRRLAFVSSQAAQVGVYGYAAYSGSKYALRGFSEVLRMELEHTGPLVTTAFPPDTDTPGFAAENVGKPSITHQLSSAGGLASPDGVAASIFLDVIEGKAISTCGLEGALLSWATAGIFPPVSAYGGNWNVLRYLVGAIAEMLAAGPIRAIGIVYAAWMRYIVSKYVKLGKQS
ncbi:unnamed protein product [Calicophoron daubneyi]|uniref:3-dehydrosphinganine reductase n=1 Tax=Calicophoron daubneyi TaxID=300641 RepID=A0AAV2TA17_CALDB